MSSRALQRAERISGRPLSEVTGTSDIAPQDWVESNGGLTNRRPLDDRLPVTGFSGIQQINLGASAELAKERDEEITPVLYPNVPVPQSRFVSLQKWEGAIQQISEDSFIAIVYDKTQFGADEEVEISTDEVSEGDLDLLRPGAIFYWNIGYHDSLTGQRTRASIIRFRRLPVWSKDEIDAAKREAERVGNLIGWK